MMADAERVNAYAQAIAAAVHPGDVVVDIGSGPGFFSLLACRAGARRVFAIETDESIQVGRELAAANGLTDRIVFFQSDSTLTDLPERANVVLSDIRGVLPLFQSMIPVLEDAKRRFLLPGGTMIPQRDILKAALIEAPVSYSDLVSPWEKGPAGLDLSSPVAQILNQLHSSSFQYEQLLSAPLDWGVLDYAAGAQTRVSAELDFSVARAGTAHGLCLWFEANLFENIAFSSQPGKQTVYGQLFLPWLQPVQVTEGAKVHIALHADLITRDYVWRWESRMPATPEHPAIHFAQSTFQGSAFSPQSLRRQELNYVPMLSETGQAELWMLEKMRGEADLQSIAQGASAQFPGLFPSWQAAFRRVADLSKKFSR